MNAAATPVGSIRSLFRYPRTLMVGERLAEGWVDERGLRGDHACAAVERATGIIASVTAAPGVTFRAMAGVHATVLRGSQSRAGDRPHLE